MAVVRTTFFVGALTTGLWLAAPADADPGSDPCHASITFICRMLPMMPDLDHDVDLTEDPYGLTGGPGPGTQPSPVNQPGPATQPGLDGN